MDSKFSSAAMLIVGALFFVAGAVLWYEDDSTPVNTVEVAVPLDARVADADNRHEQPPLPVSREIMKDLSSALLSGDLTEPAPEFLTARPEPSKRLIDARDRGIAANREKARANLTPVPGATEAKLGNSEDIPSDNAAPPREDLEWRLQGTRQGDSRD